MNTKRKAPQRQRGVSTGLILAALVAVVVVAVLAGLWWVSKPPGWVNEARIQQAAEA